MLDYHWLLKYVRCDVHIPFLKILHPPKLHARNLPGDIIFQSSDDLIEIRNLCCYKRMHILCNIVLIDHFIQINTEYCFCRNIHILNHLSNNMIRM